MEENRTKRYGKPNDAWELTLVLALFILAMPAVALPGGRRRKDIQKALKAEFEDRKIAYK